MSEKHFKKQIKFFHQSECLENKIFKNIYERKQLFNEIKWKAAFW